MPIRATWLRRLGFLLAALFLVQSAAAVAVAYTEWHDRFGSHFVGFSDVSVAEFYGLVNNHTEVPLVLMVEKENAGDERILRFSLPRDSIVYVSASAGSAEVTFVHPLILKREDGRRFLLPLIRSDVPGRHVWNSISLGHFSAGDHVVRLTQDSASTLPIPDSLQLSVTRPSHDSYLSVFIDHSPVVKLKDSSNVLDDIPLVAYGDIEKRGGRYKVTTHIIFSSENGGTKPVKLMTDTQRTLDVEWVLEQVFRPESGGLETSYRRFQKSNHGQAKFAGKEMLGTRPVLAIVTANNNFGDGRFHLGSWHVPMPFVGDSEEVIYYAPKPIFLEPGQWSKQVIDRYPELQKWSQYELAMEKCVDLDEQDDPAVQRFLADLEWIRQRLSVTYPDRGCGSQLLQLSHPVPDIGETHNTASRTFLGAFSLVF